MAIQGFFLFWFQGHPPRESFQGKAVKIAIVCFFQVCVTSKMIFQMLTQAPDLTLTLLNN